MMRTTIFRLVCICLAAIVSACGASSDNRKAATPTDQDLLVTPALVESIEIRLLESFPVQVQVVVKGILGDVCTTLGQIAQLRENNTFRVTIMAQRPAAAVCAAMIAPFETTISLDANGLPAGTYFVDVNGARGSFTLDIDNYVTEVPAMKGYELYSWEQDGQWFFALLDGTNRLKDAVEIMQPQTRLNSLASLQAALSRLPSGADVFWSTQNMPQLAFPPESMMAEIRATCRDREIRLTIDESFAALRDRLREPVLRLQRIRFGARDRQNQRQPRRANYRVAARRDLGSVVDRQPQHGLYVGNQRP